MTNQRKHRQQMTLREIAVIENLIHAQSKWLVTGEHITRKMSDLRISWEDINFVLKTGIVVEVNKNRDLCAVFRANVPVIDPETYPGTRDICVVVNLPTRWVVTVWCNSITDLHSTLDLNNYRWRVNLIEELKMFCM